MIGFHSINSTLHTSFQNQKFHHAILLQGKKGIGKATFAREFVAEIFGGKSSIPIPAEDTELMTSIFEEKLRRRMPAVASATDKFSEQIFTKKAKSEVGIFDWNGYTHPDLLLIEKEAGKKEITVDKIRKIADFVNQTSAISPHKFIIIDSACELNKSAANALLKILEEPHPNNFLILISHKLHRILPTIRSRCFSVKIPDLTLENFTEILRQKNPRIAAGELEFLSEICDNSPADALTFSADLTRFYGLFLRSILNKKIGEELLKKISDKNFSFVIFEKIFEFFISRLLKNLMSSEMKFFFDEQEVFTNLTQKFSNKEIFAIADETLILLHKTTAMSLDKKLSFINIFNYFLS